MVLLLSIAIQGLSVFIDILGYAFSLFNNAIFKFSPFFWINMANFSDDSLCL